MTREVAGWRVESERVLHARLASAESEWRRQEREAQAAERQQLAEAAARKQARREADPGWQARWAAERAGTVPAELLMAEALLPPPTGSGVVRTLPGGVRLLRRTLVEAVREIASRHGMAARTTDRR